MTKEQTSGPREPQGIGIKGIKMGSRRSKTRQHLSAQNPLHLPHCFRLFPSTSSPLPPLNPSQPALQSASPLNYQPLPPQPLNPFPLAQGSPSPLNYHQLPLNPFQLVQKSVLQLDYQQFPQTPSAALLVWLKNARRRLRRSKIRL